VTILPLAAFFSSFSDDSVASEVSVVSEYSELSEVAGSSVFVYDLFAHPPSITTASIAIIALGKTLCFFIIISRIYCDSTQLIIRMTS